LSDHSINIDQGKVDKLLSLFLGDMKESNSFLFSGPKGCGKVQTSINFSLAANCQNPNQSEKTTLEDQYCGNCKSCKKIKSRSHPDIIFIEPTDQKIKIDTIRDIIKIVSLKPYEARYRLIIIKDADLMNLEASNALLKSLEEPPANTIFVLTTSRKHGLIDTILSRCYILNFKPLSFNKVSEVLNIKYDFEKSESEILSILSDGDIEQAQIMGKKDWIKKREWIIDEFVKIDKYGGRELVLLSEKISIDKNRVTIFIKIIISFLRDIEIYKNNPDLIVNKDKIKYIKKLSLELSSELVFKKFHLITDVERSLKYNLNLKILIENMIFGLANI
jgi:DNA polymerase-3 subunit delta'